VKDGTQTRQGVAGCAADIRADESQKIVQRVARFFKAPVIARLLRAFPDRRFPHIVGERHVLQRAVVGHGVGGGWIGGEAESRDNQRRALIHRIEKLRFGRAEPLRIAIVHVVECVLFLFDTISKLRQLLPARIVYWRGEGGAEANSKSRVTKPLRLRRFGLFCERMLITRGF
jgi:hypothetical protein